jgi:hypothetical protein
LFYGQPYRIDKVIGVFVRVFHRAPLWCASGTSSCRDAKPMKTLRAAFCFGVFLLEEGLASAPIFTETFCQYHSFPVVPCKVSMGAYLEKMARNFHGFTQGQILAKRSKA